MNSKAISKIVFVASTLLVLAACGGGGGGGSGGGGTTNSAPIAAASDQTVDEQTTVTLDGSASSDPDGDTLGFNWIQTGGVSVNLANTTAAQATFESPDVGIGQSTTLTFQLRVSDSNGAINSANVDVVVNGVTNTDPVVSAGANRATTEQATVSFAGTATDSDIGDVLSYAWTQVTGTAVTIINDDQLTASFVAPAVGAGGETLTFQLAVNDGTATVTDALDVVVSEAAAAVDISGKVQYEFVPPNNNCAGLNFNAIQTRPVRAATVQLIDDATGNVLDSMVAADDGDYAFNNVAGNLDVRVRVRAELKRSGAPSWDVEVRDNVDTSPSPPPLGSRPLYVYEEAFNSGGADLVRDVTATTGWDGASYTGTRAAAPFAILDAIYSGMQLVLTADATATFGPMDAFWSVNNTLTSPSDIDAGELSSSFYRGDLDSLFLLGDANTDTEEFDDHVSVHEWGHYFEDVFSRSDSIGGPHSIGQSIDARLAFGEGWATALAAMALDEPQYCDTGVPGTSGGFGINTETNNSGAQGWFNEMSVATFIYDLYDTNADGTDGGSIGFGPIFDTMTGPQNNTSAFTTLFSFATELRASLDPADLPFLDSQLIRENIDVASLDIWGSSQDSVLSSPNQARDVLPLYTTLPTNGDVINICTNSDYDSGRDGNKLAEYRYLRFTTSAARSYSVTMTTTTPTPVTADTDDRDQSDPDIYIFRRGQVVAFGISGVDNTEVFTTSTLAADTYVADPREFRFADEDGAPPDYPEQICFDISMTPL
ncbi:MAG: PKD domain-containing protein [Woeseiaceae bacterium]